jgi:hypothetical protein
MPRVAARRVLLVPAVLVGLLLVPSEPASAQSCVGGTENDFNGDGVTDVAIADPDATVGGYEAAGRVHVVYGNSGGSQTISQDDSFVTGSVAEAGDRFGFALAAVDYNEDGCTDLVVGVPFEQLTDDPEGGMVQVVYGSPTGFGPNGGMDLSQNTAGMPGGREPGDRFGWSVAAGVTTGGDPFLVIGVPGEGIGGSGSEEEAHAGAMNYVSGSTMLLLHQDSPDVGGTAEAGDQYAFSVAASARHVAVGNPGEAIGPEEYSGAAQAFTHVLDGNIGAWNQDSAGQSGAAEPSDWCGRHLSMVEYVPPGGGSEVSLAAVSCPGEAVGEVESAGRVVLVESDTGVSEVVSVDYSVDAMEGALAADDYFGWSVELVNRSPGAAVGWDDLVVAAGVPGREGDGRTDAGGVHVYSGVGAPGDHDAWFDSGDLTGGLWAPRDDARAGQFMGSSSTHLFVADPSGSPPSVYAVPWTNLVDGASDPVRVYQPGADGLPSTGVGTFGAVIL